MPFIKVYIHFVWNTKNRISFLAIKEIRKIIWNHIRENAHKKGIQVDFINGYSDHNHCLIALDADQTIEKVMETLKGETTFWINKKGVSMESFPAELPPILDTGTNNRFEWQDNYFTIAVSESTLDRVKNYSRNQKQQDSKQTFEKKYDEFIIKYGFHKFADK
jgi:REP element-mobilizing transposase RayT